jgi:hypothetical protein
LTVTGMPRRPVPSMTVIAATLRTFKKVHGVAGVLTVMPDGSFSIRKPDELVAPGPAAHVEDDDTNVIDLALGTTVQ